MIAQISALLCHFDGRVPAWSAGSAHLNNRNLVGSTDGRQPVRDHDGGASFRQALQRVLHQALADGIERTGSLIEQQDAWVLDKCARNCHTLLLPTTAAQPNAVSMSYDLLEFVKPGKCPSELQQAADCGATMQ